MEAVEFTQLVHQHGDAIRAFLWRRASGLDAGISAVEDIEADVWAMAWQKREQFPDETEAQLPWLYAIARNLTANHIRKTVNRRNKVATLFSTAEASSAEALVIADLTLQGALTELTSAEREVMVLSIFENLGPAEIANVLEITPNAVSLRLHKSRQKISEYLERIAAS
jgi:RNA polymerase sigma-70 factor (ECF subfamily)